MGGPAGGHLPTRPTGTPALGPVNLLLTVLSTMVRSPQTHPAAHQALASYCSPREQVQRVDGQSGLSLVLGSQDETLFLLLETGKLRLSAHQRLTGGASEASLTGGGLEPRSTPASFPYSLTMWDGDHGSAVRKAGSGPHGQPQFGLKPRVLKPEVHACTSFFPRASHQGRTDPHPPVPQQRELKWDQPKELLYWRESELP